MRIFICGSRSFGATVLEELQGRGHDIPGVAAPVDDDSDSLFNKAASLDIPVTPAGSLRREIIASLDIDLIVSAFCHDFIGERTRDATRFGGIGYHPSLLPRHRGRDAIEWTIRMRDPVAGGTVYWLANKCDGGDIAAQRHCLVRPDDTARSLYRRELFPMGIDLILRTVEDVSRGIIIRTPQDGSVATWEPSISPTPIFKPELPRLHHDGDPRTKVSFSRINTN